MERNMRYRHIAIIGLLVLTNIATIVYFVSLYHSAQEYDNALYSLQYNYDSQISGLAMELATKQNEIGHATYFIIGIPLQNKTFNDYPACYLGCMDMTFNGVNVRKTFIQAYDNTLNSLRK